MPANDLTVKAQWTEEILFVEIVFGTADMSEAEISDALKDHTDGEFTIDRIEIDASTGTIQVIVKFNDPEKASEFVRNVEEEIKEGGDSHIRDVAPLQKAPGTGSYSHKLFPVLAFFVLSLLF